MEANWTPTRIQIALDTLQVRPHLGGLLVTQIAILFERLVGDFFQPRRQIGVQANRRDRGFVENCVEDRGRSLAAERQRSRGHFIEHSAERKKIGAMIQFLSQRLFGRHIRDRAQRSARDS